LIIKGFKEIWIEDIKYSTTIRKYKKLKSSLSLYLTKHKDKPWSFSTETKITINHLYGKS